MMDREKTIEFLSRVPLFATLSGRQLQSLARSVVEREYAAGEEIVTQGKGGIGLFIVVSGQAEAVRTRLDGTRTVVNTFEETDFFGELTMLTDEPRTASVIAVDKVHCLVLSRWEFLGQLKLDADMAIVIMEELARRFQRALEVL